MTKQETGPQEPEEASREFSPVELEKIQENLDKKVAGMLRGFSLDVEDLERKGKTVDESVEKYRADADGKIDLWDLDQRVLDERQLYKNLIYHLSKWGGVEAKGGGDALDSIAVRRAMEEDERLKAVITAITEAIKVKSFLLISSKSLSC